MRSALPPGQRERPDFPRFGLTPFATRFPSQTERIDLHVSFPDSNDAATPSTASPTNVGTDVRNPLAQLPRVEQTSDFHCVTTWTRRGLQWGGVRRIEYYGDFYEQIVVPLCRPGPASGQAATDPAAARFVVLRAQDGARTSLPLEDLQRRLPPRRPPRRPTSARSKLRNTAPRCASSPRPTTATQVNSGVKHLHRIEFWRSCEHLLHPSLPYGLRFMVHPRAFSRP